MVLAHSDASAELRSRLRMADQELQKSEVTARPFLFTSRLHRISNTSTNKQYMVCGIVICTRALPAVSVRIDGCDNEEKTVDCEV